MIDWEVFFEDPVQGVIPLVMQARTLDALKKCYAIVVGQLFRRETDAERRRTFEAIMEELLGATTEIDVVKERLIVVFRHIKEDRKERVAQLLSGSTEAIVDRRLEEPEIEAEPDPTPIDPPADAQKLTPARAFSEVFAQLVRHRFDACMANVGWCLQKHVKMPFLVAPVFAHHFEDVIRDHLGEPISGYFPTLMKEARLLPEDEFLKFFRAKLDEPGYRKVLWEAWQGVWTRYTRETAIPQKPVKKTEKKSMFSLGKGKDSFEAELADWKARKKAAEEHNLMVAAIRDAIFGENEDYIAPLEDDLPILMQMFGRSVNGITKEIEALRQIAGQGGELGRVFDNYAKGRRLDISLLAVAYQFPTIFFDENQGILGKFVGGLSRADLESGYPLVTRFLKKHLGRFAE